MERDHAHAPAVDSVSWLDDMPVVSLHALTSLAIGAAVWLAAPGSSRWFVIGAVMLAVLLATVGKRRATGVAVVPARVIFIVTCVIAVGVAFAAVAAAGANIPDLTDPSAS
jgi:hypothetical protein